MRLVKWYTKLGFHLNPCVPIVRDLKTILPEGGVIYPILAVVVRVYPMLYMEKKTEGYSGMCYPLPLLFVNVNHLVLFSIVELYNEKLELRKAANYDKERQACWEELVSVVTREVERENDENESDDYVKNEINIIELQVRI